MEKFKNITGIAVPLPLINIDTDMLIPKQFLKTIKRTGLGVHLFSEMRYDDNGEEIKDFVLNKPSYKDAQIIIAGGNFGCGSSREHAPWALLDYGIKVIISTSFADIFYNNCFKNGILPIVLDEDNRDLLMEDSKKGSNSRITVDLQSQEIIRPDGSKILFEIDQYKKHCLIEGLDDVALTLEKNSKIDTFEVAMKDNFPWL
jgi:3-isopropylmalate/(R)-2-methylmalate dehydratase small subunit